MAKPPGQLAVVPDAKAAHDVAHCAATCGRSAEGSGKPAALSRLGAARALNGPLGAGIDANDHAFCLLPVG